MAGAAPILFSQNTPTGSVGGPAQILTSDDVRAVLTVAASALGNNTLAAAVVDRTGNILGVYSRPGADERTPDYAVSLARTGAMFANDQAPLSSRTVRFISGIHYPPGVQNTANAALYGVENINRGCKVDFQGDAVFNQPFPRPKSIAGVFGSGAGGTPLPCEPSDTSGCARGGPMLDDQGAPLSSVGITTGKADVYDTGQDQLGNVPVNPGGIPIYREEKSSAASAWQESPRTSRSTPRRSRRQGPDADSISPNRWARQGRCTWTACGCRSLEPARRSRRAFAIR